MRKSYWEEFVLTTTHLINQLSSKVLGFKSLMEILLSVYPNMRTISHLIRKSSYLGVCALCMFKIQTGENWTQEQLILFLWDICQPKKGISVTIHHPNFIFFVSTSVTFNENESYFLISRLQGENLITKDKNLFSCFIDPFLIDHLKVSDPISIPLIDHINPPKVSDLVFVPFFKLKSFIKPTLHNQTTDKVYSRKKVAVPRPIHVQKS